MGNENLSYLLALKNEYTAKVSLYKRKLDAVLTLLENENDEFSTVKFTNSGQIKPLIDLPDIWDQNLSQKQKIYYIMSKIKEGFATDVASELVIMEEEELSLDKAKKIATLKLSSLKSDGLLAFKNIGGRYKYEFIEKQKALDLDDF